MKIRLVAIFALAVALVVPSDTAAKPSSARTPSRVKSVSIKIIDQEKKFPAPRKSAEDDSITVDFPFKGKIHAPGTEGYTLARQKNYAYKSKYADEMYPAYFVYPENGEVDSIISAIEFGRRSGLHVMGRSGGHQYCGTSSDSGSVIIDMQEWDDIGEVVDSRATVLGSKLAKKYKKMITVGAGATLGELSKKLARAGCTIPMGECPSVCVGGHMQTGGWGHLVRSNGLFSEYVYGFTIVTSEGVKKVSCKSLGRELDLYNAVRGGSPGAFGIITDVTFLLLSDDSYPNSRAYGQLILIRDDEDYEVVDSLMKLFLKTMNDVGNSSKAQGVSLNFTHIARAMPSTVFTKIPKIFPILPAKLFQRVEALVIEANIVDDTDASSMEIFQDVVDATDAAIERTKRRWIDFCIVAGMRLFTPKTFKDGKTHVPLSTINESYVREYPFVSKKTATNPQQKVNEHPFQVQSIYPKEHVNINVDKFVEGNKDSSSNGGKMGLLAIYKSIASLVGPHMPLDEIISQSYLLGGTKRGMGPFPCTAQWMTEIRGSFGQIQWGTKEGISDPRTWQIIQAFYDLEREYMLRENEIPCCPAGFTGDASSDTSLGGCVKDSESLDLTKERVQKRYYVPESEQGFGWVASVKYDWDREDIFHSRFTVPPRNKTNL